MNTKQRLLALPSEAGRVTDMAWSSDETKLAVVTDQGWLSVWYTRSGTQLLHYQLGRHRLLTVAWEHRGHALAIGGANGSLYRVRRLTDPVMSCHVFPEPITLIAWSTSPLGRCLVVSGHHLIMMNERGTQTGFRYASAILDAAWSVDHRTLAVVCADGLVEVIEANQSNVLLSVGTLSEPRCLSWRKDGRMLAIGTADGQVHFYDPCANQVREAHVCTPFPIQLLAWGARELVLGSTQGKVAFWKEPETQACLATSVSTPTFALNFQGTRLATAQLGNVAITTL